MTPGKVSSPPKPSRSPALPEVPLGAVCVLLGVGLAFSLYRWAGGGYFFSWQVATPYSSLVAVVIGGVSAVLIGLWVVNSSDRFTSWRSRKALVSISLVWIGFGAGLFGPPTLGYAGSWVNDREGDRELTRFAFVDFLPTETTLLTQPVTSLTDLRVKLDDLFISISDFWILGERIEITGHSVMHLKNGPQVLQVTFELNGVARHACAYGELIAPESAPHGGALIIPGTGSDQGLAIARSADDNYHCCIWDALEGFGKFALVKPNEGARAIHNGYAKLGYDFIVVDFLNRGGSYSASYIAEAAAMVAFLKSYYGSISLLGLSQGGEAAVVTSLLVEPDALVVASGYSVVNQEQVQWAGANSQIIIPGMAHKLEFESLSRELRTPTLFTWGKEEPGTYGIDARDGITCGRIQDVGHFHCLVHENGHVYPESQVIEFLQNILLKAK